MNQIQEYLEKINKNNTRFELRKKDQFDFQVCKDAYVEMAKSIVPNWDDKDKELTDQLIYYCIGSDKFKGDLSKGIVLMGNTGVGKTVVLKTLSTLFGYMFRMKFAIYTGWEMERVKMINDQTNSSKYKLNQVLAARIMGIDDLGEEHATVKVYGTDINVGIESVTNRHLQYVDKGHLTFITTNLNAEMIKSKYGARIESRLYEMCNLIGVKGNDLRKVK